jgi:hypothetical protein
MQTDMVTSFGLDGETDFGSDDGEKRWQSLPVIHGRYDGEEAFRVSVSTLGNRSEFWLMPDDARKLGQWLTRRTAKPLRPPRTTTSKGPANG